MRKIKICFVFMEGSPNFLGGGNLFYKNLIKYIHLVNKNISISWAYFGRENKRYLKDGVEYFELKSPLLISHSLFGKNFTLAKFFKKNYFDIINTLEDSWIYLYKKKRGQEIIHTYHGTRYYFNKNHSGRLNLIQKRLLLILLGVSWIVDRPNKDIKKLICVSDKVKRQVERLYGKRKNIVVIRTGVDLKNFKPRDKKKAKEKLGLDKKNFYGLYVGGGGYWTKGLDRVIEISKEIYKLNKDYRLIVGGADYNKVKHFIDEEFVIYIEEVSRKEIPYYYNASDVFFCMSRYEGGAPTLVVSEAMASGCLVVCAKSAEQEIIKNSVNGLIIDEFGGKNAKEILDILKDKKKKENIIKNSMKTIKELSLEKWGEKYLDVLIK